MAKPKRDWAWRRLLGASGEGGKVKPLNYRRPDFMENKQGRTVRFHCPHPTKAAEDRFFALTKQVENYEGNPCVVWTGGDTFRVDDDTVTTPARFYWETMKGEKLAKNDVLRRGCKTPRCVKHKKKVGQ